ncbi:TssQ family T6SS-associated lipoprotein [Massilia sp. W12]|uniref:TssQ family T6SS-associated lipoprotein n=1 Tax=Massilia sp. W12 TaxID=3126507 RepID=UPI0030CF891D
MKTYRAYKALCWAVAIATSSVLLSGCETPPPAPAKPVVKPAPPKPTPTPEPAPTPQPQPSVGPETIAYKEGLALYNNGNFNEAVKRLSAPEIWNSRDKSIQAEAAKYMAFSYCVTNRRQLCRQQFDRLLKLEPGYELSAAEKGHPLWGPVFVQAKKAAK